MAYLGNVPAQSYTSYSKQDFTTSATTSYTLDYPVTNENEIALFINFVRQEPTTAYTASGTTLTLSSATSGTDDMYCVYLGKAVQTVNPPSGSVGTSQLGSTLDFSSKTITLASNMKNTPAFMATRTSDQSISDNATTKVQFDSEVFDTDSCYDNSTNYRFTPNVAGKYYIYSTVWLDSTASNNFNSGSARLYKNGSLFSWSYFQVEGDGRQYSLHLSLVDDANGSSDYYEIYAHCDTVSGSSANVSNDVSDKRNIFGAYKIIE